MTKNKVRLHATQGADEANWSGSTKPYFVDRNTGDVEVDEEAVAPLLEKGGFVLAEPPVVEMPKGKVRVKHVSDPTASCAYGGAVFTAKADGSVLVPVAAVAPLAAHGFVPVPEATAEDPAPVAG